MESQILHSADVAFVYLGDLVSLTSCDELQNKETEKRGKTTEGGEG